MFLFTDELEKAMQITSQMIHSDWPKLYRHLSFKPPRGQKNIEADIDDVIKEQYRGNSQVQALDSLTKWRRLNSLSSVSDLKVALIKLNRQDIVRRIEHGPVGIKAKDSATAAATGGKKGTKGHKQIKAAVNKFMMIQGPYRRHKGTVARLAMHEDPELWD